MATLQTSAAATTTAGLFITPPKYIEQGMICRSASYTFTANQSAGDVVQMVPIPKGAQVHDVSVVPPAFGGSNYVMTVGDGNSAARYIGSFSVVTALQRATAGVGYSYSAEDTIDISITSVSSASAVGTVRLTVFYSMDQSTDGTGS